MKPVGPIPAGFTTIGGELAIDGRKSGDLMAEAGQSPVFIYSRSMIGHRIAALRAAMPAIVWACQPCDEEDAAAGRCRCGSPGSLSSRGL